MKHWENNCTLEPGKFYFVGDDNIVRLNKDQKPLVTLGMARLSGWHLIEPWGCWASERRARLKFSTKLKARTKISVFILLHVPPGTANAVCTANIGGLETVWTEITAVASWRLAEGFVSDDGSIDIILLSNGQFSQPDNRKLFIGLHSLAYCDRKDLGKRLTLFSKTGFSFARQAVIQAAQKFAGAGARKQPHSLESETQVFNVSQSRGSNNPAAQSAKQTERLGPNSAGWQSSKTLDFDEEAEKLEIASHIDYFAPEVAPHKPYELVRTFDDTIDIRNTGGRPDRSYWGNLPTLRGISAFRGFCISSVPLLELQIALDGRMIYRGGLEACHFEGETGNQRKYVFNVWHDFSDAVLGRYEIEFRFVKYNLEARVRRDTVVIAAPLDELQHPDSDALIPSPENNDSRPLEDIINSRPSMVRTAKRALFKTLPASVLIVRVDQLGDMVCSVPGIRRLREHLPQARIAGLISPANYELAASLKLFDDIIVADFPDDKMERRRIMPIEKQRELRQKLEPYKFDVAIDLSDSGVSRPLLYLSGAPFRYGFRSGEFPWLSAGFDGGTRDIVNGLERVPHGNKIMGLIEWFGVLLKSHATIERREDLTRDILVSLGLQTDSRFVVLHTGARLVHSRWPYYHELAALILARTGLSVVVMVDDPKEKTNFGPDLVNSGRFLFIDKRPTFDQFDALLSFCEAFVGNDSGPKHLAALRGANVVSIHMARNNWNEWGQENNGLIISRRVPCAGCCIHHEPEECGKGFACIVNILPQEVYKAIESLWETTSQLKN